MEMLKPLEKSFAKAEAKVKASKGDVGAMKQFVVLGIFILIGVIVYANVFASSPRGNLDATANTTLNNLNTTWYNSVDLLIIVFLVIAAVVILAYVGRIGGGGQ
jgi:hypothetical protein